MAIATMRNFNTLKSFDRLKKVGVSEEQAREFVSLFEESVNASMENLATKSDLQLTDTGLSAEIQALDLKLTTEMQNIRLEFKTDIAELRYEMTQQFSEQGKKLSALETGQILMQRLFFGGTLLILLSIGALFLHH